MNTATFHLANAMSIEAHNPVAETWRPWESDEKKKKKVTLKVGSLGSIGSYELWWWIVVVKWDMTDRATFTAFFVSVW